MQTSDNQILKLAIEALSRNTDLHAEILDKPVIAQRGSERMPDAVLRLIEAEVEIPVEIKFNPQQVHLGALIDQVNRLPGPQPGLLAADYINPKIAEKLKDAGIQFIDTAGNAYINRQSVCVLITGKKRLKLVDSPDHNQTGRAFEPKGLMVTYAFLEDPSLVTESYREIARVSGVAVGTVGWVISALKAGKYLIEDAGTGKRRITNYDRLLDQWVSAWPEKLKHKHLLGKFIAKDSNWWKHTSVQKYGACWGGETAAALYTKQLQPQVATVYVGKENLAKLIRDSRLSKSKDHGQDEDALVYLYSPFWNTSRANASNGLASPIIVYADLIATGDPRNLKTAQRLRDEYITEFNRTA